MKLPRWIGPGAVAFLALWVLLLAAGRSAFFRDPGTFWHTVTGEKILHEGFIRADPYTFTFAGTWWVPYQWLGEVGMAVAHRAGGFDAQLLGAVTLLAAVFAWLLVRTLRTGLTPVVACALVGVTLAAASAHFHVRPHLATIALTAVTVALLADADAGRVSVRRLGGLVPLFVLWTNVHGGVIGGIGTVGLTAAGWAAAWRLGFDTPLRSRADAGYVLAVAGACGLTAFASPYGPDLVRTWHVIMGEPALRWIIQEHRPLDPAEPYAWSVAGIAALYLFVLAGVPWRRWRVTWLLPMVWLAMAFDRCRHAPLFAVVVLISLATVWPHTRWAAWLAVHRPDVQRPPAGDGGRPWWTHAWLPAVAVLLALGLQAGRVPVPVVGYAWARHDPAHWPVELLDVLTAHEPRAAAGNRLFNEYIDGGFVIYHAPGYRVFVDDRCEVFGGDWLMRFVLAEGTGTAAAVADWEREYGAFDFALTRAGSGFDGYFRTSGDWVEVKRTPTATFYRRR